MGTEPSDSVFALRLFFFVFSMIPNLSSICCTKHFQTVEQTELTDHGFQASAWRCFHLREAWRTSEQTETLSESSTLNNHLLPTTFSETWPTSARHSVSSVYSVDYIKIRVHLCSFVVTNKWLALGLRRATFSRHSVRQGYIMIWKWNRSHKIMNDALWILNWKKSMSSKSWAVWTTFLCSVKL